MHHKDMAEDGPSATPHMHGAGIVLSLPAEDECWVACSQWLLQIAQVLFSGDHLAATAVGEWITKYEDADDGFLGISRHFNCESEGYILRIGYSTLDAFQGLCLKCPLLTAALIRHSGLALRVRKVHFSIVQSSLVNIRRQAW